MSELQEISGIFFTGILSIFGQFILAFFIFGLVIVLIKWVLK
jgi:hypothetical protein